MFRLVTLEKLYGWIFGFGVLFLTVVLHPVLGKRLVFFCPPPELFPVLGPLER